MEKVVKSFYKNKKILITGATGFKGSWLSYWLFLLGAKVTGVGRKPNKNENLFKQLKLKDKIKTIYLNIENKKKFSKIINQYKPQIVFHLAAQPIISESYKFPEKTIFTNTSGTLNLLEILKKEKSIKSAVFVTSDKCYKNNFSTRGFKEGDSLGGDDPYSASKACAEIVVNCYYKSFFINKNIGIATARAGNVIGGGDWSPNRLIPDVIASFSKNKEVFLRRPNFNRQWQHVL